MGHVHRDRDRIARYPARRVVLATKHGKERQLARPLAVVGLHVSVVQDLDTDLLGTFTGEIDRVGSPREVALRKARLGIASAGVPVGLASEGTFGPHPQSMFVAADHELLAFVDDDVGIEIVEGILSLDTNHDATTVAAADQLDAFLVRVGFPQHGVVVQPATHWDPDASLKGITDPRLLGDAVARAAASATDGRALVQTDMRAHMNPTRQRVIRRLGFRLARRVAQRCPACRTPGYGIVDVVRGLPCGLCAAPTELVSDEVLGCARCAHQERRPRRDLVAAPAGQCPWCNP